MNFHDRYHESYIENYHTNAELLKVQLRETVSSDQAPASEPAEARSGTGRKILW